MKIDENAFSLWECDICGDTEQVVHNKGTHSMRPEGWRFNLSNKGELSFCEVCKEEEDQIKNLLIS